MGVKASNGPEDTLKASSHLTVLSLDQKTTHLITSWQDIEVLEAINNALRPLTDFTDALDSEIQNELHQ